MCRRGHGFDTATRVAEVMGSIHGFDSLLACVASVSVRLSARSMHFSLFWPRENWGGRKKVRPPVTHFFALAPIFARLRNKKCLERAENLTETLATQANSLSFATVQRCDIQKKIHGPVRESNPGPLAPKARIMPLDQQAIAESMRQC